MEPTLLVHTHATVLFGLFMPVYVYFPSDFVYCVIYVCVRELHGITGLNKRKNCARNNALKSVHNLSWLNVTSHRKNPPHLLFSYLSCEQGTGPGSWMDGGPPACTEVGLPCDWRVPGLLRCAGCSPVLGKHKKEMMILESKAMIVNVLHAYSFNASFTCTPKL